MVIRLFLVVLLFFLPCAAVAHEPKSEAVMSTYTTTLSPGDQVVAVATYPPGTKVLTGGYTLLSSSVTMRSLVVVENRPVPEKHAWAVTLLYDPAPEEIQRGAIALEASAVCRSGLRDASSQKSAYDL